MDMIKDCTTLEQGRMLVGLGIDQDTADKCWIAVETGEEEPALYSLSLEQARENRMTADRFLTDIARKSVPDALTPAWSLTALLDLLPAEIVNGGVNYPLCLAKAGSGYRAYYARETGLLYSTMDECPVGAAVKMIFLLKEKNIL